MTKDELRREYQRLLNELDRAPPEKLGFVVVQDPRDAEIAKLTQHLSDMKQVAHLTLAERNARDAEIAELRERVARLVQACKDSGFDPEENPLDPHHITAAVKALTGAAQGEEK